MVFGTRSKLTRFVWASFLLFVAQLAGTAAYAQSTGEIRLQVKDPSGAALQASGHVAGPATDRAFRTDAQGAFSLGGLPFGRYHLEVSRRGFASRSITIDLNTSTPVSEAVTLLILSASTSVTVFSPTVTSTTIRSVRIFTICRTMMPPRSRPRAIRGSQRRAIRPPSHFLFGFASHKYCRTTLAVFRPRLAMVLSHVPRLSRTAMVCRD